jgi:hypothetical protein
MEPVDQIIEEYGVFFLLRKKIKNIHFTIDKER